MGGRCRSLWTCAVGYTHQALRSLLCLIVLGACSSLRHGPRLVDTSAHFLQLLAALALYRCRSRAAIVANLPSWCMRAPFSCAAEVLLSGNLYCATRRGCYTCVLAASRVRVCRAPDWTPVSFSLITRASRTGFDRDSRGRPAQREPHVAPITSHVRALLARSSDRTKIDPNSTRNLR